MVSNQTTSVGIEPTPPKTTSFEQAEAIVTRLASCKDAWLEVSIRDRIVYLQRCIELINQVAEQWAEVVCLAKGIDPTAPLAGEEWFVGPAVTISNLRQLIKTLQAEGQPKPSNTRLYYDQWIAQVLPADRMDRVLWQGFKAEVWMQPGKPITQGIVYRTRPTGGTLALVLGAGNVSSISPMDALYKLFAENAVVLLKMNPVNDYMGSILEAIFQPLRQNGFLEIVYGGAELGSYLCQHSQIDTIHITGSHHTHDAIVWGNTPEKRSQRKTSNQPLTTKPITSELGCVTPVLVVPGKWSASDIAFQARHVASMVAHNASFNCAAAKVVITAEGWAQRQEFLEQLKRELAMTQPRKAYYPGAEQRYQTFLKQYPQAIELSSELTTVRQTEIDSSATLPWMFVPDVPSEKGELALTQEAFCGILAEVSLKATDAGDFLKRSIEFVNENVWGNLSCTVLIDPATQKQWGTEFETAIANLCYGAIGVNVWSAVIYSLSVCPWGAFPGNSLREISSGQGVVHNTYLFEYPQKTVLHAPFRIVPIPIWFTRHKNLLNLAQNFTHFETQPAWRKLVKVVWAALRG